MRKFQLLFHLINSKYFINLKLTTSITLLSKERIFPNFHQVRIDMKSFYNEEGSYTNRDSYGADKKCSVPSGAR